MARNDGIDRTFARNQDLPTLDDVAKVQEHNEREKDSYRKFREAGADRYLLRHETADPRHYRQLHPPEMSLENRMRCLRDLKELGYQTGTGMMIGSPGQTLETLWEDLEFIRRLRPEMIGIGPYLVHHGTPFADQKNGSLTWTLRLLSVLRLLYPDVLLPATTALSTLHPEGRKLGILAGANVVMPNLGMPGQREKYELYDHKLCAGQEAAEGRKELENMMGQIGYTLSESRGDFQEQTCMIPSQDTRTSLLTTRRSWIRWSTRIKIKTTRR